MIDGTREGGGGIRSAAAPPVPFKDTGFIFRLSLCSDGSCNGDSLQSLYERVCVSIQVCVYLCQMVSGLATV